MQHLRGPRSSRSDAATATITCALTASLLSLGLVAPSAHAQAPVSPANTRLVDLDVQDAKLEKVIQMLGLQTNLNNIVIKPLPGGTFSPVTLRLSDKPIDVVLRAVATAAGATLMLDEDGYYTLQPNNGQAAPSPQARPTAANNAVDPQNAVAVRPSALARERQWQKIYLKFMQPSTFVSLTKDPTFLHMPGQINTDPYELGRPRVLPSPPTIQVLPSGSTEEAATRSGFNAGRGGESGAFAAGQRPGGLGGGGGQGGGLGGGLGGQGGGLGGGLGGQGGGQGQGSQLLPDGITSVLGVDIDNSLLVQYDDPAALTAFRDIIRLLDVPPKQVMIKVEFIDVSVNDLTAFGIDWQIQPAGNLGVNIPSIGSGASITLAYATGNAVASLRAALTRGNTNVIQSPIVTTVNNGVGAVLIQDSIPQFTTQTIISGNGNTITQPNVQFIQVSNGLTVQPRINGDNSISLTVSPQLSSFTPVSGPNGIQSVQTQTRVVQATRRIQNGETMVLGGFISKTDSRNSQKVPILGDLPIIGSLFRSRQQTTQGTETLVFLTPTIIEDVQTGTSGAVSTPPTP